MTDRIVQYPNRYRLTQVSEDVYDITPEPGAITAAGTPICKATLLKDETAAKFGLSGDPTVDDALNLLAPRVGDITYTIRNDLGPKFLLCNGAWYDIYQYPQLASVDTNPNTYGVIPNAPAATLTNIVYGNGYYAAQSNNNTIYYTTSLTGPWASKTFDFNVSRLRFVNNLFVVIGKGTISDGKMYIAYASTPNATWTTYNFATVSLTSLSFFGPADIFWTGYHYGILTNYAYVVPGYSATTGIGIYYSTSINGSYGNKTLYSEGGTSPVATGNLLIAGNGYFAAYCERSDGKGLYYIASSNLSGTWNWVALGGGGTSFCMYANNNFVFAGVDNTNNKTRVYKGASPNSLGIVYETTVTYSSVLGGTYGNDYYFIFLYDSNTTTTKCLYSSDGANWELYTVFSASMTSGNFFDNTYGALLTYNNNIYYDRYPTGSHKQLPAISVPGAYAYIRSSL